MGNLTRAVLRRVMHLAVKQKRRKDNPMLGIEAFKVGEHHTWTMPSCASTRPNGG
jgi:hypothetical protein